MNCNVKLHQGQKYFFGWTTRPHIFVMQSHKVKQKYTSNLHIDCKISWKSSNFIEKLVPQLPEYDLFSKDFVFSVNLSINRRCSEFKLLVRKQCINIITGYNKCSIPILSLCDPKLMQYCKTQQQMCACRCPWWHFWPFAIQTLLDTLKYDILL